MVTEESNKITDKFFTKTTNIFSFLETDYGYLRKNPEINNQEFYPDTEAEITYIGPVMIKIFWYFAGAMIGVAFVELENDQLPKKISFFDNIRGSRAINLYSLVETINSNDSESFLLKNRHVLTVKEIKKREKVINENMEQVLENLASMTKTYAKAILTGDTSIFPRVQDYENELVKQNYR